MSNHNENASITTDGQTTAETSSPHTGSTTERRIVTPRALISFPYSPTGAGAEWVEFTGNIEDSYETLELISEQQGLAPDQADIDAHNNGLWVIKSEHLPAMVREWIEGGYWDHQVPRLDLLDRWAAGVQAVVDNRSRWENLGDILDAWAAFLAAGEQGLINPGEEYGEDPERWLNCFVDSWRETGDTADEVLKNFIDIQVELVGDLDPELDDLYIENMSTEEMNNRIDEHYLRQLLILTLPDGTRSFGFQIWEDDR
jgi:hypothetical protein